ncbi:hypothetical protein ASC94_29415 [Massilia sp. Root418]|uniref:nuclear transport factor 2 family protein n=1 Tax=Massilia sp. Root418 TaxID=1736532 RepID=UPI0006F9167F|nr:nuclear transport factor 2 family protein [Massilia sp. Root418]KQW87489.1 hypothetical protein ASC94_29415 [Massilia sp. Root418]
MSTELTQQISQMEERLRLAMLASNIEELNLLLADELLFTNHMGQLVSKADDLAMHSAGVLRFQAVDSSEQQVHGTADMPVVSVRVLLNGSYGGHAFAADLRYTRIWRRSAGGNWQLAVAHSSPVMARS